jgi:starch synthase
MHLVILAAENGALPKGKVGGVADVVRDLPVALTELGWTCTILSPGYGILGKTEGAVKKKPLRVGFRGAPLDVELFEIASGELPLRHVVFEHAAFSPRGAGKIYCDDGPTAPFATDASKFALFSACAAEYVTAMDAAPDVVHLHDWHAALYAVLREFEPRYRALKRIRTVYTIHNLAMQGIRPLRGHDSALESWYPDLDYDEAAVLDPRYADCVNPMAAAIRLADMINTVSPTYAEEIRKPDDPARGFRGGEGLEADLRQRFDERRLTGILNGCAYEKRGRRPGWRRLLDAIDAELDAWQPRTKDARNYHALARERVAGMPKRRPAHVLSSIGRLTDQKAALFLRPVAGGQCALERILAGLGRQGVLIMIGNGDRELEKRIAGVAAEQRNFIFLCGYSNIVADLLYRGGDLFLMPSSFEPCGISQMLAMRGGQPCVVHAVGGLRDTVRHGINGFRFRGDTPAEQAAAFVQTVGDVLLMKTTRPDKWQAVREQAAAARFSWATSARDYSARLYGHPAS